jgi:nitrogen fixation protein FixH
MVFICLVAFFAVVAGVNAIMIRAAVSTFGGVETESAYKAGLAFAREIANVQEQDGLHWDVRARVMREADGIVVEVAARDLAGQPIPNLQAMAQLAHPTDRRADRTIGIAANAPGLFRGTTADASGQWDLVIELSRDGTRLFRSKNRVWIR